jgi:hypothetical protein
MADMFRYQKRGGVQRPLMEIKNTFYFSGVYRDIDFLETVDESYHFLCVEWYKFVCKKMKDYDIIRHMGYSLLY